MGTPLVEVEIHTSDLVVEFWVNRICPVLAICFSGSSVIHKIDGRITLTAGSLLDNLHWHYVTIKRYGRQVNFTVDSQTVTAVCNGEFTHLDLDTQVLHKGAICVYNNNIMMSCMLNTFIQCSFICKLLYIKSQLYELI